MNQQKYHRDLIGIVGGMGPLASAAFLSTLYDFTPGSVEQDTGRFILYSDPAIPDRTKAFLAHQDGIVLEPFVEMLRTLQQLQVAKIVVCCITLHYLLPRLPQDLQKLIVSLIDIIFVSLQEKRERHLLLCTNATLQLGIFQNHPLWKHCSNYIILPGESDQQTIHALIYQLKARQDIGLASLTVSKLLKKYDVRSFIAGCTEFHLLSRYLESTHHFQQPYSYIDPLVIVANKLVNEYQ